MPTHIFDIWTERVRPAIVVRVRPLVQRSDLFRRWQARSARRARARVLANVAAALEANGVARQMSDDVEQWAAFVRFAPPGHFYSPIPRMGDLEADAGRIWTLPDSVPGIDHRPERQRAKVEHIAEVLEGDDLPDHATPDRRYYALNPAYGIGDATMLHGMLRLHRPQQILEIGSGYSSALILDTIERHLAGSRVTFVEPHSDLLRSLMRPGDEQVSEVLETRAQDIDVELVRRLAPDDFLFIDSTHVVRTGSDVCRIVLELLPEVAPGVVVHIHDIFWPFEMPRHWVEEGRQWAECYLVRAFLTGNPGWEIVLMNDWVGVRERELLQRALPRFLGNPGGSLWLRRVG